MKRITAFLLIALFLSVQSTAPAQYEVVSPRSHTATGSVTSISPSYIQIRVVEESRATLYRFRIVGNTIITGMIAQGTIVSVGYRLARRPHRGSFRIARSITVIPQTP